MAAKRPELRRPLVRLALVGLLALVLAALLGNRIVAVAVPAVREEILLLDDNIEINTLEVVKDGDAHLLRLRANLIRPLYLGATIIFPLGWKPHTNGWFQISANARGALAAPLLFLVACVGWVSRSRQETLFRCALLLPGCALLFAIDAPLDLLGSFQQAVFRTGHLDGDRPLFMWARFLEGGGNTAMAVALAVIVNGVAARAANWRFRRRTSAKQASSAESPAS
jgi:hypothetical protein